MGHSSNQNVQGATTLVSTAPESGISFGEFSRDVVGSVAWPIAVIVIVLILREDLRKLLASIRKYTYKDHTVDFGRELEATKEQAEVLTPPLVLPSTSSSSSSITETESEDVERLRRIAEHSPNAAVLEAWLMVEKALVEAVNRLGVDLQSPSRRRPQLLLRALSSKEKVDRETIILIDQLQRLRNEAVHSVSMQFDGARPLGQDDAVSYAEIAVAVAQRLQDIQ